MRRSEPDLMISDKVRQKHSIQQELRGGRYRTCIGQSQ